MVFKKRNQLWKLREENKGPAKGRIPWNKNKKGWVTSWKGRHHTKKTKKKISKNRRGITKGIKFSEKSRKNMSKAHKGEKSHLWRGGITPINKKIRSSVEYKLWREAVFKRDNWTCRFCGQVGGKLNADHIKPFALFPELRFAIDNGRTLCEDCHMKTDTYGRKTILLNNNV